MFTTGESRLVLPDEVLLGQKTRKQLGARGDGHSSCHGGPASQGALWGSSTVNNAADQQTGVPNDLRMATMSHHLGIISERKASASILGCYVRADLHKFYTLVSGLFFKFCKEFKLMHN